MPGDLKERVARILADEVAPVLQMDAVSIDVLGVDQGIVRVRFHGACVGSPGTVFALVMGIEQELRRRLPEVEYLEAVP
jgi:Fe-S cluster biogenesis protein NfuA